MSKFVKIIWSLVSMVPLIFVTASVLLFDYLWNESFCKTWIMPTVLFVLSTVLVGLCYLTIRCALKKLKRISFEIEEVENKDSSVAASMITYLLPLVTITMADINWVAFAGLIVTMLIILFTTKIVQLNPIVYLFRYKYYTIKAKSGVKYTLITKQKRINISKCMSLVEIFPEIYIEVEENDV